MKKIICAFLIITLLTSSAFAAEITFREIPWGSNVNETLSQLGLYDIDDVTESVNRNPRQEMVVHSDNIEKIGSKGITSYDVWSEVDCGFKAVMFWSPEFIVAGHEVSNLELQFLYGVVNNKVSTSKEDAEFVSAKYEFNPDDYIQVYEELLDKLIWLYGEPIIEESISNDSYFSQHRRERYAKWNGSNGIELLLYLRYYVDDTSKYQYELSLEYAKTDIDNQVKLINDYFLQIERDQKYNDENTAGL